MIPYDKLFYLYIIQYVYFIYNDDIFFDRDLYYMCIFIYNDDIF